MKKRFTFLTTVLLFSLMAFSQSNLNEDFEQSTTLPSSWTFIFDGEQEEDDELGAEIWVDDDEGYYSGRANSGDNSAWIYFQYCMDENAKIYMISPKLRVNSEDDVFSFYMFVDNYAENEGRFHLYVSTTGKEKEDFSSESLLDLETADMYTGFEQYEVSLADFVGEEIYVAFVFEDYCAYTYYFIDDVTGPELVDGQGGNNDACFEITSLPFEQNFDDVEYNTIPDCWKWIGYSFYGDMFYPTVLVNGYANTNWLAFMGMDGTEEMVVSLPKLADNIDLRTLKLNLDVTNYGSGSLVVGVMEDAEDINTFTPVSIIEPDYYIWTESEVSFADYDGDGKYISLRVGYPYETDYVFVGVENIVLDYAFNPNTVYDTIEQTICANDYYHFKDEDLNISGTYFDTVSEEDGNLEIEVLILTVNPVYDTLIEATINSDSVYAENGFYEDQEGEYLLEFVTVDGCDSIVMLNLQVIPVELPCENTDSVINVDISENSTYTFNGTEYSEAGTYTVILQTTEGCDSLITLNINIIPAIKDTIEESICYGEVFDEFDFNINTLDYQNVYQVLTFSQNLQSSLGYDSISTLVLTVNPTYETIIHDTADIFSLEEEMIEVTEQTLSSVNGCDSVITTYYHYNPAGLNSYENQVSFSLYPNPTVQNAVLTLMGLREDAKIMITDGQGRLIKTAILPKGQQTKELELADLPVGVYYLRIQTSDFVKTEKIIKK